MKVLVTGGAGFIGSEFVRQAVSQSLFPIVVDSLTYAGDLKRLQEIEGRFRFYKTDITNKEFIEYIFSKEKPEIVVHFAAESHVDRSILDPQSFLKTNILGTQVLLDAARRYEVKKFLNISTDEVYGELGEKGRFKETSSLNPNSPYSVSKASADMLGRAYYRTYGLPVITVRPCNNYGPWQYPEKFIPVIILRVLKGEKVPIYGKGENIREWLYVSDCAKAILEIMKRGREGEIYNIGSGQEARNIEIAKKVLKLLGKDEDWIEFVKDRPGHDFRYALDFSKITEELGWKPQINLEEGLEKSVSWYLSHKNWLFEKYQFLKDYWERVYL